MRSRRVTCGARRRYDRTPNPDMAQGNRPRGTGITRDKVKLKRPALIGGGFGAWGIRAYGLLIMHCLLSKAARAPVKVMWDARKADIRNGRPPLVGPLSQGAA